jgi:primosomal protein N' (replication factor Y)
VASSRLFRLKAEVASAPSPVQASSFSFARVRVNTGVFHLDDLYDYLIPEKFSDVASIGVRVQVPFGNREVEGIIVERAERPDRAGALKFITKVVSIYPIATMESLNLIDQIASFYACSPWDVIRSAIPPRVTSVDKKLNSLEFLQGAGVTQQNRENSPKKSFQSKQCSHSFGFIQLAPVIPAVEQVATISRQELKQGSVLIVAPDDTDVDQVVDQFKSQDVLVLKLASSMPREERYENFLRCKKPGKKIIVGTRSSIFAPIYDLATIIVYKESSPLHYELRSPGWNSKTVALKRAHLEGLKLLFMGYSPSVEIGFLIDKGEVSFRSHTTQINVSSFSPDSGTLLPGRIFSEIRSALRNGPVLFLAARKGYGNALLCAHCRNIALCQCGGRLQVGAKTSAPMCVHCGESFSDWRCKFCNRNVQYLAGRGIERASEEISRAFPGYPVVISAGEVIKENVENRPSIVLSTPGAQPSVKGGYSAVVILDAIRFFSHTDFRTQERAREIIFESVGLLSKNGKALLVIDPAHPIVPAITRWSIAPLIKRELAERLEINLPPYISSAVLLVPEKESVAISTGFRRAVKEGRLPESLRIFGPTPVAKNQAKLVLYSDISDVEQVRRFLLEFQKKRSISKKDLIHVRVEPYSL